MDDPVTEMTNCFFEIAHYIGPQRHPCALTNCHVLVRSKPPNCEEAGGKIQCRVGCNDIRTPLPNNVRTVSSKKLNELVTPDSCTSMVKQMLPYPHESPRYPHCR